MRQRPIPPLATPDPRTGCAVDDLEKRVLQAIDVDGLVAYVCDLVAVPSLGGEERSAQEHVAGQMDRCGLAVDVWQLDFDRLSKHPAFSVEIKREEGLGVVGAMGAGRGPSLIYNGHVDVVPPGDDANWSFPPWRGSVAHGKVYGRGALDMKGGLSCALFAAKALRDAGVGLAGKLMIESVIGEEDGGVGTLATVVRGYRADGAVIMEPTRCAVAPAQAGALNFRITVPGRSAHGCVREEGVSAIEKFVPLYQALMRLERDRNREPRHPLFADQETPYAICIGTVRGGTWASSVAESLRCEGRYGVAVGEDLPAARRMLEKAVMTAADADPWLRQHRPHVEWWGAQFHPGDTPVETPIVRTVTRAYRDVSGDEPRLEGMTYGADLNLLTNHANTPTVLFGPGDIRHAHRPDEFVTIDDLVTVARTLALTAVRFCGVDR